MSSITKKSRASDAALPQMRAAADGGGAPFLGQIAHSLQAANSAARPRRAHNFERDIRRPIPPPGPVYLVWLQAQQDTDARHALRGLLKVALRRFGLRCLSLREVWR